MDWGGGLSKKDVIRLRGEVTEVLPDSMYRVKLDNEQMALCVASGRMRKNFIRVVVGDRVVVEFSPTTSPGGESCIGRVRRRG